LFWRKNKRGWARNCGMSRKMYWRKLLSSVLIIALTVTLISSAIPVPVDAGDMGKAGYNNTISLGFGDSAAITAKGDLYTWGMVGQLGHAEATGVTINLSPPEYKVYLTLLPSVREIVTERR